DPANTTVRLHRVRRVRLATFLRLLLAPLEGDFIVRGDHIEVTSQTRARVLETAGTMTLTPDGAHHFRPETDLRPVARPQDVVEPVPPLSPAAVVRALTGTQPALPRFRARPAGHGPAPGRESDREFAVRLLANNEWTPPLYVFPEPSVKFTDLLAYA